jgi:hypothetical protein
MIQTPGYGQSQSSWATAAAQNGRSESQTHPIGRSIPGILAPITAPTVAPPQKKTAAPIGSAAATSVPPFAPSMQKFGSSSSSGVNQGRSLITGTGTAPISLKSTVPQAANASGPSISCRVPVQSVGALMFPNNVAVINGRSIEIRGMAESSDLTPPSLRGIVIRSDAPSSIGEGERELTGLAYFTGGTLYLEFGNRAGEDMIFRNEGTVFGDIVGHDEQSLLVRQKDGQVLRVPLTTINYLRSPRAFLFTLTGKSAASGRAASLMRTRVEGISFQPTFTENLSESTPTSILPERKFNEDEIDDEPPGFTVTSSQSRYQPALGSPVFNNNMPGNMGMPRRMMPNQVWP